MCFYFFKILFGIMYTFHNSYFVIFGTFVNFIEKERPRVNYLRVVYRNDRAIKLLLPSKKTIAPRALNKKKKRVLGKYPKVNHCF